jgi:hypothetical protein
MAFLRSNVTPTFGECLAPRHPVDTGVVTQ